MNNTSITRQVRREARLRLFLIDALVVCTVAGITVIVGELSSFPFIAVPMGVVVAFWCGRNS